VLNIGGVERDFTFKSHPASSRLVYQYFINKITNQVTLGQNVEVGFWFKNAGFQEWELDLHGDLNINKIDFMFLVFAITEPLVRKRNLISYNVCFTVALCTFIFGLIEL